jgi:hypothetical protein
MSTPKRSLGLAAFLCATLTTSFAATELLYAQQGQKIITYSGRREGSTCQSSRIDLVLSKP